GARGEPALDRARHRLATRHVLALAPALDRRATRGGVDPRLEGPGLHAHRLGLAARSRERRIADAAAGKRGGIEAHIAQLARLAEGLTRAAEADSIAPRIRLAGLPRRISRRINPRRPLAFSDRETRLGDGAGDLVRLRGDARGNLPDHP